MDGETIVAEGSVETLETTETVEVEKVETEKPEEKPAEKEIPKEKETEQKPEEKPKEEKETSTEDAKENKQADELAQSIIEKDSALAELTAAYEQEKANTTNIKATAERLETVVNSIVETKVKAVPEEYKGLIPDGDAVSKLEWLTKAETSGLFGKKENPAVEIGRNLAVDKAEPTHKQPTSPTQRLSNVFSTIYKK